MTVVTKVVSDRKRLLMRLQNGCENFFSLNQLTVVIVENIPEDKEPEVSKISEIPEEQVKSEKGYYQFVYVILRFKNEVSVDSKEEQEDMEDDPDEEEMDDITLDDERERDWSMVFKDNDGGVDDAKALLHDK